MNAPATGKLLFVCTANICRSPMAECLMRHALDAEEEPLRSLPVSSAGLAAGHGDPASRHSQTAMEKVGLSLENHRSRPVTPDLLENTLAIIAMTQSHQDLLEIRFTPLHCETYLLREFITNTDNMEIPDPYGMDLRAYEACRDSMVEAIPGLLQFLKKNLT